MTDDKIRLNRQLMLAAINKREKNNRLHAAIHPYQYKIVERGRQLLAQNKVVAVLYDYNQYGSVLRFFVDESNSWMVLVEPFVSGITWHYKVENCRFFYCNDNGNLKEIK